MDIKETKEVVSFMVKLAMAVDKSQEDGYQWTDILALIPPMMSAPSAIDNIYLVPEELQDLDQEERNQLIALIEELELNSESTEVISEQALITISEFIRLVKLIRRSRKV